MKKIINNKKLFITTIILLLFCNYFFPNIVFAAVTWRGNSATGSIQEVLDSMRLSGNASNQTIKDKVPITENSMNNLKQTVIKELKEMFPRLEEDMYEKTYNYYRNDQDMIEITCNIGGGGPMTGYYITSFTVSFGSGLTLAKIEEDVEGKTEEEIGETDTDTGSLPPASAATGQDPDGDTIIETESGSDASGDRESGGSTGSSGSIGGKDEAIGLPDLNNGYKPGVTMPSGGKTMNIVESILGVFTVLGVIAVVLAITLMGFGSILGSASEKAQGQEKYGGLLIAAILITCGSIIARIIISVASSLQ